jgi:Tfp pilus assembly protein PilX
MIVGLTILAVLTFIAIGEVRKTHANGREQQ